MGVIMTILDFFWTALLLLYNKLKCRRFIVKRGARISFGSKVFGNVVLEEYAWVGPGCDIRGNVHIGKFSRLNGENVILANPGRVYIGNYTAIGPQTIFITSNHDYTQVPINYAFSKHIGLRIPVVSKGDIRIGHDVWVGARVVILSGVRIGNGAVVGAGSIVTKNLPEYSIAVGVPARPIKKRFPEDRIRIIEKSRWYLRDVDDAKKLVLQIRKELGD